MTGPGNIENTYTLHITNSDEQPHRYTITVGGLEGLRLDTPAELTVAATSDGKIPVRLVLPAAQAQALQGQTMPIQLAVSPDGRRRRRAQVAELHLPGAPLSAGRSALKRLNALRQACPGIRVMRRAPLALDGVGMG